MNWTWICGGRRHRPLGIQDIEWAAEWVSASQHEPSMFSRDPLAHEGEAMILVQTRHNTLGKPIDTQLWRQGQSDAPRLQPRAVAATAPDNLIGRNQMASGIDVVPIANIATFTTAKIDFRKGSTPAPVADIKQPKIAKRTHRGRNQPRSRPIGGLWKPITV